MVEHGPSQADGSALGWAASALAYDLIPERAMEQTWRWFGPDDPVLLEHAKQAGATGIVTALHHVSGAWSETEVLKRRKLIEDAGLRWSVVESIPVDNAIKTRSNGFQHSIDDWIASLRACARAGVTTICYNFMPVVDWTRTNLMWLLPTGGYALRFDMVDFAVYDLFVLERPAAREAYSPELAAAAEQRFRAMGAEEKDQLERNIIAGLPGADFSYDRAAFRRLLATYEGIGPAELRAHLVAFLREVVPVAEEEGTRLGIHPDDPPFSLFGLPRIVSTADDIRALLEAVDAPANGLTFCVGSYGARPDNNIPEMVREFASRIHFAHLRNVTREPDGSFYEAEHLDGDSDMIAIVAALMGEEVRRRAEGREDWEIPMRPDHGHLLLDDIGKRVNPGYSCIGRLKGLAELRGVMRALAAQVLGPRTREPRTV
jgi:mannonate dehydratase